MNSNDWTQLNMNWFYWHKYRFYRHEYEWTQLNWTWISSVQSLIRVSLFATPWTTALQVSLSITNSWVYPNSCPLSQWCHLTISSSVVPFSSCLQSFPPSGSFQRSQFFRIRRPKYWSRSLNISASNEHPDWFPLGWTDCISLQAKGLSRVFSNTTVKNYQFFCAQLSV